MGLGSLPSARLTAAQLTAVAALISDCARPTAEAALLTAMAALLSRRCAISPCCCPALSLHHAPNGEAPNPREEQIIWIGDEMFSYWTKICKGKGHAATVQQNICGGACAYAPCGGL